MSAQVEAFDDLDAVARDAGGALDRAARAEMFERLDWFRLVHDLTPPPGKLLALRARNDVARGWLFLSKEGAKAAPLSNWYSLRCGPVIEGAQSESVLDGLVEGLRRAGVGELALSPLGDADGLEAALKRKRLGHPEEPVDGQLARPHGGPQLRSLLGGAAFPIAQHGEAADEGSGAGASGPCRFRPLGLGRLRDRLRA
jgi:hypothetical protein